MGQKNHLVGARLGAEKAILDHVKTIERFDTMSDAVRHVVREFGRAHGLWPPNGDSQQDQEAQYA